MKKKILIPALTIILLLSMTAFMLAFATKQGKGPPEYFEYYYTAADTSPYPFDKVWYSGVKTEAWPEGKMHHLRGLVRTYNFFSSIGDGVRRDVRNRECALEPAGYPENVVICITHGKVEIEFMVDGIVVGTLSGNMKAKFESCATGTYPCGASMWIWGTYNFDRGTSDYEGYHAWGIINSCLGHY